MTPPPRRYTSLLSAVAVPALATTIFAASGLAFTPAGSAKSPNASGHQAGAATPAVPAGYVAVAFGTAPAGLTNPDDITRLGKDFFVSYQNNAGPDGTPAGSQSTVVEFSPEGTAVNQWNLTGRCDGLTADSAGQRLLATINEDANSSLAVIRPHAAPADQVRQFSYSPDPATVSGGGTDAITVFRGRIYVSASNPSGPTVPALYRLTLPVHGTTASLRPVFNDNAQALQGNSGASGSVTLNLTDPDSNAAVPARSPRFAHDFMLDSQGDSQLIFASHLGTAQQTLTLLNLGGPQVDDVRWANTSNGSLYVVDQKANQVWRITGPFPDGTAYTSIPNDSPADPGTIAALDLTTGAITPFATNLISPKGLIYVSTHGKGGDNRASTSNQGNPTHTRDHNGAGNSR